MKLPYKVIFVFFYPAILAFIFPYIYNGIYYIVDIIENFVFAFAVLLTCVLLFPTKKIIILVLLFLLYFFGLIETVYLVLFRTYFSSSSLFIFFESNPSEIKAFANQYSNLGTCFIFFSLLFVYLIFAFFYLKNKIVFLNPELKKYTKIIIAFTVFFSFAILLFSPLKISFLPKIIYRSIQNYNAEINAYNKLKFKKKSSCFYGAEANKDTISETYVLVIGESTTRTHMGIYNYQRSTTPLLNSISNELLVYQDVVTPNTHTLTSLEKVLTLGNTQNIDLKYKGNILQLFNQAGFSTFWLSNQKPSGIWDNFITAIANSAQKKIFFNISDDESNFDDVLFNSYKAILKSKEKKKLIILHLMGTHLLYKNRYPALFAKFNTRPKSRFLSETAILETNHYDNAVLYQDYIWYNIIKLARKNNGKTAVLLFSDHGEEVYDCINFSGHTESKGTKSMYDIPFILWRSDLKIKEKNNLIFDINRKYSTEDLLYSMADLASIKFGKFESDRSIFNKQYESKKRIIFNGKTYDEFFKK
ncbi:phosphoethanolamine transferase [Flavobacterium sp.]|uniref:phosphoethanolamine transferase n=1 Tax=Flavobacterium sp. TaxID=239 RepID=UPI0032658FFF